MTSPFWTTESEYLAFLQALDEICTSPHSHVTTGVTLRFDYSVIETTLGVVDIFQYQAQENWDTPHPPNAYLGQGMFRYSGDSVRVNDRCDQGYKYRLPFSDPELFPDWKAEVPSLEHLIAAIYAGKNITQRYTWNGP